MTNNKLAENSITQLLNSVKLARDNAERDDNRVDHSFYYALTIALEELQERRRAAMDSEPVAYMYDGEDSREYNGHNEFSGGGKGIPLYRHAQPVVPDDVQRDAKRWRALLGSARIRILGSAGFDATAHPGENPDYRHFGMEIWTHYPNWLHEKNEYGIDTLTQYADAMLAAAPQSPGGDHATVPDRWIPVSERIPGRYYVLAADFSGRYYHPSQPNTQVGIYDDWFGDGKPTWDDGDGNDLHLKQVTHWMPLPSAPQEVKGE